MADQKHEHGTMDVSEQERIYAAFWTWTIRTVILIFIVLGFMALTQT
ncbi:MAG: aa3-type cytochrome c oxidase subunit IV [Pseudomonadota bacterium]